MGPIRNPRMGIDSWGEIDGDGNPKVTVLVHVNV